METLVPVLGQQIRVKVRAGTGVPLVLCNGIGASLEVLDPFVEKLNPHTTVVRFDVPGTGGSPNSPLPYGFPYLALVVRALLRKLDIGGQVDILGVSWGGALAQQFAFQNPRAVPSPDPGVHRHWRVDGSRAARGAGEDADTPPFSGSRVCGIHR